MALDTMYPGQVNSPATTLSSGIDSTQTTIPVADPTKLPDAPNLAVIGTGEDAETILYTGKDASNLTGCTRGLQGAAKAWDSGIPVARRFTEKDYATLVANLEDLFSELNAQLQGDTGHAHYGPEGGADPSTFARASTAYKQDGTQVASDAPRLEDGPWAGYKALMVEEGVTNRVTNAALVSTDGIIADDGWNQNNTTDRSCAGGIQTFTATAKWGKIDSPFFDLGVGVGDGPWTVSAGVRGLGSIIQAYGYDTNNVWIGSLGSVVVNDADWVDAYFVITREDIRRLYIQVTDSRASDWTPIEFTRPMIQLGQTHPLTWHPDNGTRAAESLELPSGLLSPTAGTIEGMVYVPQGLYGRTDTAYPRAIQFDRAIGGRAMSLHYRPHMGDWMLYFCDDVGSAKSISVSRDYVPAGNFRRYRVDFDADAAHVYWDNQLAGTIEAPPVPSSFGPGYVGCANSGGAENLNTLHADIRISNIVRTSGGDWENPLPVDYYTVYKLDLNNSLDHKGPLSGPHIYDPGNVLYGDAKAITSVAIHPSASANGSYQVVIGHDAAATVGSAIAIGPYANVANYTYALALGYGAQALQGTAAIGYNAVVQGVGAIAVGEDAQAKANNVVSIGRSANYGVTLNPRSLAVGYYARSDGEESIAIGSEVWAEGYFAIAVGWYAEAAGFSATAVGGNTVARESFSVALGYGAFANGERSTALGYNTRVGDSSTAVAEAAAIGARAEATEDNQGVLGVADGKIGPYNWLVPGNLKIGNELENEKPGKGIIIKTPDGTKRYRIAVDNSGNVTSTLVS